MPDLPPKYSPHDVESRWYREWESRGYFHSDPDSTRRPYTIVIPPPNVTGILHMGHALNNTIQDVLIRWHRMQGDCALWVPGTDHAGIATQNVVEKQLAKEGRKRQDLGRERFLKRVWAWKEQYGNTIITQLKRLGSSCDWQRTRFTMDEGLSGAVTEVFVRLYEQKLIYRGNYIVNWCPRCQTALSDEEAPHQDVKGHLYYIKYPLEQSAISASTRPRGASLSTDPERAQRVERVSSQQSAKTQEHVVVATTRPETMLGDMAVAVHPVDARYKQLVGQMVRLPLTNRTIPVIADEMVDREFGTGAVKITPAHDPNDFNLWMRKHGPDGPKPVNIMQPDGTMNDEAGQAYAGLDRFECRERVLKDLAAQGLLEKTTELQHAVSHCYRCHTIVEPRLSLQWFVRMEELAKPAIKAVEDGTITFHPARWKKVYLNWMHDIRDWCISRQIWWGHRLPVYYCDNCVHKSEVLSPKSGVERQRTPNTEQLTRGVIVSKIPPKQCPACGSTNLRQDEDVLDTWFSSWLWPFSTLGWPQQTADLNYFYPTSTLVTAPEILFFWVARMIMAGYRFMGRPPFTDVYIHGTVRDITGKKMSKSLGNIIDPLEIIEDVGADALRYTLVAATPVGQDVFLSNEQFQVGRNFANKLWNAARFILQAAPGVKSGEMPPAETIYDQSILERLNQTVKGVTEKLEVYQLNEAAKLIFEFLWHEFCDWHIELVKPSLAQTKSSQHVIVNVFEQALRLLHPFMPFITEELWQHFSTRKPSIMVDRWLPYSSQPNDKYLEAVEIVDCLKELVTVVRDNRATFRLSPKELVPKVVAARLQTFPDFPFSLRESVKRLAGIKELELLAFLDVQVAKKLAGVKELDLRELGPPIARGSLTSTRHVGNWWVIVVFLFERTQGQRETYDVRMQKTREELKQVLKATYDRLNDSEFLAKAPQSVIQKEREKVAKLERQLTESS